MSKYNIIVRVCLLLGFGIILWSKSEIKASTLISEDKIWEYYNREGQPEGSREFTRYKFSGTETVNNFTYHKFIRIYESTIINKWTPEKGWEEIRVEDYDKECVALLREDEDRVYLLLDPQNLYAKYDKSLPPEYQWCDEIEIFDEFNPYGALHRYHDPENGIYNLTGNEEVVLYDFTENGIDYVSNTKVLKLAYCVNDRAFLNVIGNTFLESIGTIDIHGKQHKTYTVIPEYLKEILETVSWPIFHPEDFQLTYTREFGNIGRGTLFELTNEKAFDGLTSIWGEEEVRLNRVLDLEGNVLYSTPQTKDPSVLHEIDLELTHDLRSYDLMGREIRNPQPGTVYICGGKKFVAK